MQNNLPGYTLEEALELSSAGLNSSNDRTSTVAMQAALNQLTTWLQENNGSKERLLAQKRYVRWQIGETANQVYLETDNYWKIPQS